MSNTPYFCFDTLAAARDLLTIGNDEDFVAAYEWVFSGSHEEGSFDQVCVDAGYNPLAVQEAIRAERPAIDRQYREIVTQGDGADAQEFESSDEDLGDWPL